jgi:uncharacterized membrane protein
VGFGNFDSGEAGLVLVLVALVWLVPIALTIWLFRLLASMASAQREIAGHLARIAEQLRAASGRAVT